MSKRRAQNGTKQPEQPRGHKDAARLGQSVEQPLPREYSAVLEEAVERDVKRWARKLLLVTDGEVRRLTDEEIAVMLSKSRKGRRANRNTR